MVVYTLFFPGFSGAGAKTQHCKSVQIPHLGSLPSLVIGKRGLLEKGSFQESPCLEILEHSEILEILRGSHSVESKGESDHLPEILEKLEILEILEIPPVKRPLS